jgi:hypothetical protein
MRAKSVSDVHLADDVELGELQRLAIAQRGRGLGRQRVGDPGARLAVRVVDHEAQRIAARFVQHLRGAQGIDGAHDLQPIRREGDEHARSEVSGVDAHRNQVGGGQ